MRAAERILARGSFLCSAGVFLNMTDKDWMNEPPAWEGHAIEREVIRNRERYEKEARDVMLELSKIRLRKQLLPGHKPLAEEEEKLIAELKELKAKLGIE